LPDLSNATELDQESSPPGPTPRGVRSDSCSWPRWSPALAAPPHRRRGKLAGC